MEQRIRPWRARLERPRTIAADGTRLTLPGRRPTSALAQTPRIRVALGSGAALASLTSWPSLPVGVAQ